MQAYPVPTSTGLTRGESHGKKTIVTDCASSLDGSELTIPSTIDVPQAAAKSSPVRKKAAKDLVSHPANPTALASSMGAANKNAAILKTGGIDSQVAAAAQAATINSQVQGIQVQTPQGGDFPAMQFYQPSIAGIVPHSQGLAQAASRQGLAQVQTALAHQAANQGQVASQASKRQRVIKPSHGFTGSLAGFGASLMPPPPAPAATTAAYAAQPQGVGIQKYTYPAPAVAKAIFPALWPSICCT